jgi:hypothetical protein
MNTTLDKAIRTLKPRIIVEAMLAMREADKKFCWQQDGWVSGNFECGACMLCAEHTEAE